LDFFSMGPTEHRPSHQLVCFERGEHSMRISNIVASTLFTFAPLLACDAQPEATETRSAQASFDEIEAMHSATAACVQGITVCLQGAEGDSAAVHACLDEMQSCLPGEDDIEDEEETSGMPEDAGRPTDLPE